MNYLLAFSGYILCVTFRDYFLPIAETIMFMGILKLISIF